MLKFLRLGAAIAAVLSTQFSNSLLTAQAHTEQQLVQASTSLVITEIPNAVNANSILIADSSTNTPDVLEKVGSAGIMLGLAAVGGGAIGVALSARNAKHSFKSGSISLDKKDTIHLDQASRDLQKKLLRLLHDDRDTADRLLSQVKIKNPSKPINWCVEKVIYDLERDRGAT